MRKVISIIIVVGLLVSLGSSFWSASAQDAKKTKPMIGVVNLSEAFLEYKRRTDWENALEDVVQPLKDRLRLLAKKLMKDERDFARAVQGRIIVEGSKEYFEKRQALDKAKFLYKQDVEGLGFKIKGLKEKAASNIKKDITAAVAVVAKRRGFLYVFRKMEKRIGEKSDVLVYSDTKSVSITKDVINELNKKWDKYIKGKAKTIAVIEKYLYK